MPSFKIIGLMVLEKKIFKGFATYSHGGNNFCSPFLRMLHIKFGFDWPSGFRGDVSLNIVDNNESMTTTTTVDGAWVYYKLTL